MPRVARRVLHREPGVDDDGCARRRPRRLADPARPAHPSGAGARDGARGAWYHGRHPGVVRDDAGAHVAHRRHHAHDRFRRGPRFAGRVRDHLPGGGTPARGRDVGRAAGAADRGQSRRRHGVDRHDRARRAAARADPRGRCGRPAGRRSALPTDRRARRFGTGCSTRQRRLAPGRAMGGVVRALAGADDVGPGARRAGARPAGGSGSGVRAGPRSREEPRGRARRPRHRRRQPGRAARRREVGRDLRADALPVPRPAGRADRRRARGGRGGHGPRSAPRRTVPAPHPRRRPPHDRAPRRARGAPRRGRRSRRRSRCRGRRRGASAPHRASGRHSRGGRHVDGHVDRVRARPGRRDHRGTGLARRARVDRSPGTARRGPRARAADLVASVPRRGMPRLQVALLYQQAVRNGYQVVLAPEGVPTISVELPHLARAGAVLDRRGARDRTDRRGDAALTGVGGSPPPRARSPTASPASWPPR